MILCKKVLKIVANFFKTARKSELLELIIIPLIALGFVVYIIPDDMEKVLEYSQMYNDSVISVVSLLAAFGIATITILLTSSSSNIQEAKNFMTNRKDLNNKTISYFQLLLIRNFYSLIIQLTLLLTAIIVKLLFLKSDNGYGILYLEVFMLVHVLLTQFLTVTSIYHLLWKEKV